MTTNGDLHISVKRKRLYSADIRLRQAREEAGLTLEELARRINTKNTAIPRIENHVEDIKISTLEKFAKALENT
jgi:HTH-type transcriptional regulator / antitoxin HipB